MMFGQQRSGGESGVTNNQDFGYGARCSILYRFKGFAFGPFLKYWHIDRSDIVGAVGWYEPENYTIEYGLRLSYQF